MSDRRKRPRPKDVVSICFGLRAAVWQSSRLPHSWDLHLGIHETTHRLPQASTTGVRNHRDGGSKFYAYSQFNCSLMSF